MITSVKGGTEVEKARPHISRISVPLCHDRTHVTSILVINGKLDRLADRRAIGGQALEVSDQILLTLLVMKSENALAVCLVSTGCVW